MLERVGLKFIGKTTQVVDTIYILYLYIYLQLFCPAFLATSFKIHSCDQNTTLYPCFGNRAVFLKGPVFCNYAYFISWEHLDFYDAGNPKATFQPMLLCLSERFQLYQTLSSTTPTICGHSGLQVWHDWLWSTLKHFLILWPITKLAAHKVDEKSKVTW